MKYVVLALAGALGTLSRYFVGGWVHTAMGERFPYGTMAVNVLGSFIIGFLGTLADDRFLLSPQIRAAAILGFLGAFTTYSSFTYETWNLIKDGELWHAGWNVGGTVIFCLLAVMLGVLVARLI